MIKEVKEKRWIDIIVPIATLNINSEKNPEKAHLYVACAERIL